MGVMELPISLIFRLAALLLFFIVTAILSQLVNELTGLELRGSRMAKVIHFTIQQITGGIIALLVIKIMEKHSP
jgi:hypothetical protein